MAIFFGVPIQVNQYEFHSGHGPGCMCYLSLWTCHKLPDFLIFLFKWHNYSFLTLFKCYGWFLNSPLLLKYPLVRRDLVLCVLLLLEKLCSLNFYTDAMAFSHNGFPGPSLMSISPLVQEIWQFLFTRDWPETLQLEIHPSELC